MSKQRRDRDLTFEKLCTIIAAIGMILAVFCASGALGLLLFAHTTSHEDEEED